MGASSSLDLLDLPRADLHVDLEVAVVDELLLALLTLEPFPHLCSIGNLAIMNSSIFPWSIINIKKTSFSSLKK
jgi:hypothetical protein